MKIKLLTSLLAATILAGCSSSSGSKSEDIDPGFDFTPKVDNPIELDPEFGNPELDPGFGTTVPTYGDITETHNGFAITGDNGAVVTVDTKTHESTVIYTESGVFTINENNEITNYSTGEVVGHVQITDDKVTLRTDNGTEIVLRNENGRLFAAVIERPDSQNPIEPEATLPILGDILPVNYSIVAAGEDSQGDSYRVIDAEGKPVAYISYDDSANTAQVTVGSETHKFEEVFVYKNDNGQVIGIIHDDKYWTANGGIQDITTLKSQVRNLSNEQKSQLRAKSRDLREAIKAKVERS